MYILSYDIASKSLALSLIFVNKLYLNEQIILFNRINVLTNNLSKIKYDKKKSKCVIDILKDIVILLDKLIFYKCNITSLLLFDIVDLIPNRKLRDTSSILRSNILKSYLNYIDKIIYTTILDNEKYIHNKKEINISNNNIIDVKVLLEYQMGPNDKSRNVCSQILYNYSQNNKYNFKSLNHQPNLLNTENIINFNKINYTVDIVGPSLKNKINLDDNKTHQFFLNKYSTKYDANKKHSICNLLSWINHKIDNLDKLNTPNKNIYNLIKIVPKKNLDDIADSINMTLAWLKYNIKI